MWKEVGVVHAVWVSCGAWAGGWRRRWVWPSAFARRGGVASPRATVRRAAAAGGVEVSVALAGCGCGTRVDRGGASPTGGRV